MTMKRIHIALLMALATIVAMAQAQSPSTMLDKCIAAINASGGVTASYSITTSQGTSQGKIAMQGSKFRVISPDAKC